MSKTQQTFESSATHSAQTSLEFEILTAALNGDQQALNFLPKALTEISKKDLDEILSDGENPNTDPSHAVSVYKKILLCDRPGVSKAAVEKLATIGLLSPKDIG
jgi:hypothetical protein